MSEDGNGHDTQAAVRTYLRIFVALGFLTLLTVGVAYMNLPDGAGVLVALLIAVCKIYLIGSFFMHLRHEGKLINVSMAVCLGLILILLVFVLPDLGIYEHEIEELRKEHAAQNNPYLVHHQAASAGDHDSGH